MALNGDSWLTSYDGCETLGRDIMEKITVRNQQQRNSTLHIKVNSQIRPMIKKFNTEIGQLRQDLNQASLAYRITQHEAERRQRMLDNLASKERQMEMSYAAQSSVQGGRSERSSLLGNQMSPTTVTSWMGEESEESRDMSVADIQQKQMQVIEAQDQGLEALSRVISRQKQMAIGIGTELDVQNEIIDDIVEHVDTTHNRLIRETKNVSIVSKKSGSCGYWIVILLLLVAIIVILCV